MAAADAYPVLLLDINAVFNMFNSFEMLSFFGFVSVFV